MKELLKEILLVQSSKNYPPEIVLKPEVKELIQFDSKLRTTILLRYEVRELTLTKWINKNSPVVTSLTFIVLLLNYFADQPENKYKSVSDLVNLQQKI